MFLSLCRKSKIPGFPSGGFLVRSVGFVSEHPGFGSATLLALLPPEFFDSRHLWRHLPGRFAFDFVEQNPPRNEGIESLPTSRLAINLQEAKPSMEQHHARRRFIDILAPMPSRSHKRFFNIGLTRPQGSHPLGELLCLIRVHWKCGHGRSLVEQFEILKAGLH